MRRIFDELCEHLQRDDVLYHSSFIIPSAAAGMHSDTKQPMVVLNPNFAKAFTEAELYFILAHELGHIVNGDESSTWGTEYRADAFALHVLHEMGKNIRIEFPTFFKKIFTASYDPYVIESGLVTYCMNKTTETHPSDSARTEMLTEQLQLYINKELSCTTL